MEYWNKNIFFVLAVVGASVGLGNVWRFPYIAYDNGGGAFLIPFFISVLLVGIPLVILEMKVGFWSQGSIVKTVKKINPKITFLGWWILLNSIVIVFYYAVVLAWAVQYLVHSFSLSWGNAPDKFLFDNVLGLSSNVWELGTVQINTLFSLAVVWIIIYFITSKNLARISKVLIFTVPIPIFILIMMLIDFSSLEGANIGIEKFITPKFSKILDISVWAAAASQVILSLGIGMGQIITYASRRKNDDNTIKLGVTIVSVDVIVSLIAGLTIFATMGFLSHSINVPLEDLKLESLPLAFVSYPMAINNLIFPVFWGVLFFLMIILLGLDSAFAVIEINMLAISEEINISRKKFSLFLVILCFLGGLPFVFGSGLYWLDIVDHWVANYAIASIIILQLIVFTKKDTFPKMFKNTNIWIHKYYRYFLPIILFLVFSANFLKEFQENYNGYPTSALLMGGWGVLFGIILISIFLSKSNKKKKL